MSTFVLKVDKRQNQRVLKALQDEFPNRKFFGGNKHTETFIYFEDSYGDLTNLHDELNKLEYQAFVRGYLRGRKRT